MTLFSTKNTKVKNQKCSFKRNSGSKQVEMEKKMDDNCK